MPPKNKGLIRPTQETRDTYELTKQFPERIAAVRSKLAYAAAELVLAGILTRLPDKEEIRAYRSALVIGRIPDDEPMTYAYAVFVRPKHRKVKQLDGQKTILYVRPLRKLKRVTKFIQILADYSPWTVDTLPIAPSRNDALVIHKKVSLTQVDKVGKWNVKMAPKWRAELAATGVHLKKGKPVGLRNLKTYLDVMPEAIRLEFGLDGKSKAHWRPTLQHLMTSAGLSLLYRSNPGLTHTLRKLHYAGWTNWPPKTQYRVSASQARKFVAFQSKLGIKIQRHFK